MGAGALNRHASTLLTRDRGFFLAMSCSFIGYQVGFRCGILYFPDGCRTSWVRIVVGAGSSHSLGVGAFSPSVSHYLLFVSERTY